MAGKRLAPSLSLGALILAVQWADLLFWVFCLLGIEHFRIAPGTTAVTPFDFYDYPWSHGLVALGVWGLLLGAVYFLVRRRGRVAVVLGLGVVSHWFLDAFVHRPDMPVLPRGPYAGLGLWNSPALTVAAELLVFGLGLFVYLRSTVALDRVGVWALRGLVVFLVAAWLGSLLGGPPQNERIVEWSGLAMWLLVPWGYWIDRHRTIVPAREARA